MSDDALLAHLKDLASASETRPWSSADAGSGYAAGPRTGPAAALVAGDAAHDVAGADSAAPVETSPVAPPAPRPVIAPLTPERYRLQFTVSKETHDTLRRLQDLLCREVPNGDPSLIFERALNVLLCETEKKRLGATTRPRRPRGAKAGSRHVPAHVRRAVWKPDGAQCAFLGKSGRCEERRYLEWHHCQPFGKDGPASIQNISLRCRAHNVYESELVFGAFQPGVVREQREKYGVPGKSATFRNGGAGIERTARSVP